MSKEGKFILYKITFPNGKIYIGYTSKTLKHRKQQHYYAAKHYKSVNGLKQRTPIMNAIKKFQPKEKWQIIGEFSSLKEAHAAEIATITCLSATEPHVGYNLSAGGDGIKHTNYTKSKISKSSTSLNYKRFSDPNNRQKQSLQLKKHWETNNNKEKASIRCGARPFFAIDLKTNKVIGEWLSQRQCARDLNISPGFVNNVLKGRRIGKLKYTFKYRENYEQRG